MNLINGKNIKKYYKIGTTLILAIMMLPAIFYGLFLIPYVQTRLAGFVVAELSKKFNTEITIEKARVKPFHKISLYNVLIKDRQGDSLLYVGQLDAEFNTLDLKSKYIHINEIDFNEPSLKIIKKDSLLNFSFLFNEMKNNKKDTMNVWSVIISKVRFTNSEFSFSTIDDQTSKDFNVHEASIYIDIERMTKDTVKVDIKGLTFRLDNNLTVKNITSGVFFSKGNLNLTDLNISTNSSTLVVDSLATNIDSLKNIKNNGGNALVYLNVKQGSISDKDIKFFYPKFNVFKGKLRYSGLLKGTIAALKGKNINLEIGKNTKLRYNFSVDGLPDLNEAFIFVSVKYLSSDAKDLERIISNANGAPLNLPASLSELGTIRYKGNLTGFLTDLVAFGSLKTDLGTITTDVGLKKNENDDNIYFGGNISTTQFNLGKLLGDSTKMGNITMNMSVKGNRSPQNKFLVFLEGNVDSLSYDKHQYKNIYLSGLLANQHFNGHVFLRDPNGMIDFNGMINFTPKIPEFDFYATIDGIRLNEFNILNHLHNAELSLKIETNIKGITLEDLVGYIRVDDLSLTSDEKSFEADSIILLAEKIDSVKHVLLESDMVEGEITGIYNIRLLKKSLSKILYNFMPALKKDVNQKEASKEEINNFNFVLNLKKMHDVVNILMPHVDISDEGMIMGEINAKSNYLDIEGELDHLNINNISTDKISVYLNSRNNRQLSFVSRFRTLSLSNALTFNNLSIHQKAAGDSLLLNIFWNNWDEKTNSGSIYTNTRFSRNNRGLYSSINLKESQIIVGDSLWTIQPCQISIYPEGFTIKEFRIWSLNQQVAINGFQNKKMDDLLNIYLDNLNIGGILKNQKIRNLDLNGILTSEIHLRNMFETPVISSDLSIRDFVVNSDTLGKFILSSKFDSKQNAIKINTSVKNKTRQTLYGNGNINLTDRSVDLEFDLDSLPVAFLNMYLGHIMQNIRGTASGTAYINGTIKSPELTGRVNADALTFDIDLLKTSYTLTDSVILEPHKMIFKDMTVTDRYNNKGVFRGTITHTLFRDMTYDLLLESKNTEVLNTTEKDNEVYYGTAFADGNMSITGITNDIKIDIVGKSTGNTRIFIPLEDNESAQETNFIKFTGGENKNKTHNTSKSNEYHVDVSGMDITMDLEITPEAKIQVIFDSKVGDVLKGSGTGDLRIKIDKTGTVFFYGEYTIEEGDYMFTLQNVLNKRFVIDNGSTIRWDGSPYNALIDLTATYKLKASMYDLVAPTLDPSSSSEFQKRVPINVKLILTDRLMKPSIRFEIESPSLNNSNQNIIDEYITTEEELNRQVLSLLVLNRFYAPENQSTGKTGTNAAVVTTTEMLSNQLSHWLSQISSDVDIGVSYRPGDEITSNEIELALSTKMFNNRVTLSSNVGYGNYQTENASNIIGDFDIEVKLNKKGSIRAKAYTHSNNDIYYETSPTTQGVGISFNEEFNSFHELMRKYWDRISGKKRKEAKQKKKQEAITQNQNNKKKEDE
jgi:uncharacterized protein YjfI (DUF2170 family)